MKKIITVLGARPQFIKASVVSHLIHSAGEFKELILHTGQHFDANMSDVFFSELGISHPSFNLGIHSETHGAMTGKMLASIEQILIAEHPDVVLVYGDTNSTLAGALAAIKLHIPVAHVEAGLRSFNMAMPEEVNRILTDRISSWLYTPTEIAADNLVREGVGRDAIISVGDVMYDVALHHGKKVSSEGRTMARLGLAPGTFLLATVHRAENTDNPQRLDAIVQSLITIGRDLPVVWPMHPRTRTRLRQSGIFEVLAAQVQIIDPVGYLDMVQLEKYAAVIVTDSGGVQKEAFFHRTPCVTIRDETEWVELINARWNRLAPPTSVHLLVNTMREAIGSTGESVNPYGEGDAAHKIVTHLQSVT